MKSIRNRTIQQRIPKIEAIAEYINHMTHIPYNLHEDYDMQAYVSYT